MSGGKPRILSLSRRTRLRGEPSNNLRMPRILLRIAVQWTRAALSTGVTEPDLLTVGGGDSSRVLRQNFTVTDAEGFDPALLSEGQRNEKSQLDKLGIGKMAVQLFPERGVGNIRVPDNRAGVRQRDFLTLGEVLRGLKIKQLIIIRFRKSLPSSLDGALHASIFAVNRF